MDGLREPGRHFGTWSQLPLLSLAWIDQTASQTCIRHDKILIQPKPIPILSLDQIKNNLRTLIIEAPDQVFEAVKAQIPEASKKMKTSDLEEKDLVTKDVRTKKSKSYPLVILLAIVMVVALIWAAWYLQPFGSLEKNITTEIILAQELCQE